MFYIIGKQLLLASLSLFGISLLFFMLVNNAELYQQRYLVDDLLASESTNVVVRYFHYINSLMDGQWGYSIASQKAIFHESVSLLPATIELIFFAAMVAITLGIAAGVLAGYYQNSWFDKTVLTITFVGYSTPIFWLGLVSILIVSLEWGLAPVSGRIGFLFEIEPVTGFILIDLFLSDIDNKSEPLMSIIRHTTLPTLILSLLPLAVTARLTRNAMIEALGSDYIQAAYAKGLSSTRIIWVHGLRNAMVSVAPNFGMQVGALVMGALVVETIFSWPGLGKWLIESVNRRDFPAIHGALLLLVGLSIFTNTLLGIVNTLLNPKMRSFEYV